MGPRKLSNAIGAIGALLLFISCCLGALAENSEESEFGQGLRQDAEALEAFKHGIERDPSGALDDWDLHTNPCRWQHVKCAPVAGARTATTTARAKIAPEQQPMEERVVGLELWGLGLEGSISVYIGKLTHLRSLVIEGNKFNGAGIPIEIENCRKLTTLDLRANELGGSIAFSLAKLPDLRVLMLSENRLTGTLDVLFAEDRSVGGSKPLDNGNERITKDKGADVSFCPNLEVLDLGRNSLSGELAAAMSQCARLQEVRLNDNVFRGEIPSTLSHISTLQSLSLNGNRLEGRLPSAIATKCHSLRFLNVSDNFLRGRIPSAYATALKDDGQDRHFDLSNNWFESPIPTASRWSVDEIALVGGQGSSSPGLCGWTLDLSCQRVDRSSSKENDLAQRIPHSPRNKISHFRDWLSRYRSLQKVGQALMHVQLMGSSRLASRRSMAEAAAGDATGEARSSPKNSTTKRWLLGLSVGLVAGALAAGLLATVVRLGVILVGKEIANENVPIVFHPNISGKMLRSLETEGSLRESNLVGVGGAARVYKVQLENGMVVAVKSVQLREDHKGFGQRHIQAELDTLGCIRHRNLVVLLAYVHKPGCHLLVYDYMQNGSLHQALHKLKAGELALPWPIRHQIAVGTCEGLTYLHYYSKPRIVHRDLKPSNILLDETFGAHVSDFGLAKVIPGADTHVTTGVAGTVGYIAPEYSQTCRFTDKGDVYSFGVVLAVLLTGKDPTDIFFQTVPGSNMVCWLQDLMSRGEGKEAIDPRLLGSGFEDEIVLAIRVAVFCLNVHPSERPNSQEVLAMLKEIREDKDSPTV